MIKTHQKKMVMWLVSGYVNVTINILYNDGSNLGIVIRYLRSFTNGTLRPFVLVSERRHGASSRLNTSR